ncbi:MAG TPA: hypothetical protein ENN21_03395 [Spirochaetes bacterium]|nr:hypothetical protein [Spirochaetota bacterium]
MDYMRTWTELDIKEVEEHIVVIDDKFGFCPGCREIGIGLENLSLCPKCGRELKYATSREARGAKAAEAVARARRKLPNLVFIDYDDYERLTSKKKAADLFKDL